MAGLKPPRTFRCYGQRWHIRYERPDTGDNGQCDHSERTIYIAPDLYDRDAIAALVDELTHAFFPALDNDYVDDFSEAVGTVLFKAGFRREERDDD